MSGEAARAGDEPDALLLDEMFSPAIAAELQSRGMAISPNVITERFHVDTLGKWRENVDTWEADGEM